MLEIKQVIQISTVAEFSKLSKKAISAIKINKIKPPRIVVKIRPRFNNSSSNFIELPRFDIKNKFSAEIHTIFEGEKNNSSLSEAREYIRREFEVQCFFSKIVDLKINLKFARNVKEKHLSQVYDSLLQDHPNPVFPKKIMTSMQLFLSMIDKKSASGK